VRMRSGRQLHVPGPEVRLGGAAPGERPVPGAGQHTAQVLAELGYSEQDVAGLLAAGVIEAERA
jgi:crotonobetainyl-CoA:carnitine CoA-transferase CaiB-like acyl-CoA transferase